MFNNNMLAASAASAMCFSMIYWYTQNNNKNRPGKGTSRRREWCRPWLNRRNQQSSVLNLLNNELEKEDPLAYRNLLRMSNEQFEILYSLIKHSIDKEDTHFRQAISGRNRLQVTLRFLATGETYRSLMYSTRIHESTISKFVPEVCHAIYTHLKPKYLKTPSCAEEWEVIANDFNTIWQFPNCLGALDGKHINFRPPISDGSYYYNYKGGHSIVLLAMANAKYKFTYVNVGINGRVSDGGVYQSCKLSSAIFDGSLNLPRARKLPGRHMEIPYVIIADEAFPLSTKLMRPYPARQLTHSNRIFNYRLSRARRIIENAFGILVNRFRILLNTINLPVKKVEIITLACVSLHNYLQTDVTTSNLANSKEVCSLQNVATQCYRTIPSSTANKIREEFRDYFLSPEGMVAWQEEAILKHNV